MNELIRESLVFVREEATQDIELSVRTELPGVICRK